MERINARPGEVWTPTDFLALAPRAAVDKTLQRLARAGLLVRAARGLYFRTRLNPLTDRPAAPHTGAVIDAVARRDQCRVLPDAMTAANDLGLTTAVPALSVVLTDARLKAVRLGRQQIRFQTAAPSRLYWAGRPAMRIIQSLYWVKDVLGSERGPILARLSRLIEDPAHGPRLREDLREGLRALPAWMQGVVRELLGRSAGADP